LNHPRAGGVILTPKLPGISAERIAQGRESTAGA